MEIAIHAPNMHAQVDALEEDVRHALAHSADRLTRVEVFLKDVNADKGGVDKNCVVEARPRGLDPVAAEHTAATLHEAVQGAARKVQRQLEHRFGKLDSK